MPWPRARECGQFVSHNSDFSLDSMFSYPAMWMAWYGTGDSLLSGSIGLIVWMKMTVMRVGEMERRSEQEGEREHELCVQLCSLLVIYDNFLKLCLSCGFWCFVQKDVYLHIFYKWKKIDVFTVS